MKDKRNKNIISVIDFGGQYAHLIATKVRGHNVHAVIRQPEDPIERFSDSAGIIISGSPSLSSKEKMEYNRKILNIDIPILGFCFGHQEIAKHYGGRIVNGGREWGSTQFLITESGPLFKGLKKEQTVWMSHFDSVAEIGPDFKEIGFSVSKNDKKEHRFAAISSDKLKRYGLQFHPEVDDTVCGDEIIKNFIFEICSCTPSWTIKNYLETQIEDVKNTVGENSVFLLVSGGVDSTVAAKLIGRAIGSDRLILLHIDNGMMRKNESRNVLKLLKKLDLDKNLHFKDASSDFLKALDGAIKPEDKRKIIGETFVEIFQKQAKKLGLTGHFLGQGTIYPDTIETGGSKRSHTIKTHHNRVEIIEKMISMGKVVEPLKDLYKVEVRKLGKSLKIPDEALDRHPFPGPGLGVRLLCSDGIPDKDWEKSGQELHKLCLKYNFHAMALPVKSVGVKADVRSYEHPALLKKTNSWQDALDAADVICEKAEGINRCVYYLSDNFPQSARLLKAFMTEKRLKLLREADFLVMEGLAKYNLMKKIWQCPTVLLPIQLDGQGRELVIIRPIHSARAMTARVARLPDQLLFELEKSIKKLPGVAGVGIDLTSKPPGTIEWE